MKLKERMVSGLLQLILVDLVFCRDIVIISPSPNNFSVPWSDMNTKDYPLVHEAAGGLYQCYICDKYQTNLDRECLSQNKHLDPVRGQVAWCRSGKAPFCPVPIQPDVGKIFHITDRHGSVPVYSFILLVCPDNNVIIGLAKVWCSHTTEKGSLKPAHYNQTLGFCVDITTQDSIKPSHIVTDPPVVAESVSYIGTIIPCVVMVVAGSILILVLMILARKKGNTTTAFIINCASVGESNTLDVEPLCGAQGTANGPMKPGDDRSRDLEVQAPHNRFHRAQDSGPNSSHPHEGSDTRRLSETKVMELDDTPGTANGPLESTDLRDDGSRDLEAQAPSHEGSDSPVDAPIPASSRVSNNHARLSDSIQNAEQEIYVTPGTENSPLEFTDPGVNGSNDCEAQALLDPLNRARCRIKASSSHPHENSDQNAPQTLSSRDEGGGITTNQL